MIVVKNTFTEKPHVNKIVEEENDREAVVPDSELHNRFRSHPLPSISSGGRVRFERNFERSKTRRRSPAKKGLKGIAGNTRGRWADGGYCLDAGFDRDAFASKGGGFK
ncbi:hypothetical protein NPIL_569021 [Nephila pilipes]|uniref:Uncharacterized protein n=1 Tax=Nephila pilipes TaxID=299642 RepID=A0A8X6Q088_NEPPI|nr:hypothetical protein NPIL_569021 [Nephila pilipes]